MSCVDTNVSPLSLGVGSWLSMMQGKGVMPFFRRVVIDMFWRKNACLDVMSPPKKIILSSGCYVM